MCPLIQKSQNFHLKFRFICQHKGKKHSSIVNKPAAVTGRHGDSKTLGRASFTVHNMHNQQAWNRTGDCRNISDIGHMRRGADLSVCYNYADPHFRDKPTIIQKYHPFMDETSGFTVGTHLHHRMPLANANHSQPVMPNRESYNKQKQVCRHYARGKCYFGDNCKFLHDLRDKRECVNLKILLWHVFIHVVELKRLGVFGLPDIQDFVMFPSLSPFSVTPNGLCRTYNLAIILIFYPDLLT